MSNSSEKLNHADLDDSLLNRIFTKPSHPIARALSFVLGVSLSVFMLFFPQLITQYSTDLNHLLLGLFVLAMCGCFVHGLGFQPYNIVAKIIFSPLVCWPISAIAVWIWVI